MNSLPDPTTLLVGALAFLRIGAIMFALPVIGDAPTPVRARVLLSLALTIGLYPIIPKSWTPAVTTDVLMVAAYVVREVMIGLVVGYVARAAFDGMILAASVVSYQMGFGTANLFMPDFNGQMDSFTAFHRILVMLIFLALGMHNIFISALVDTFRIIPGGTASLGGQLGPLFIQISGGILSIGIQLAAPILVALLFAMAAMGLVARTVPNMNAFVMSFPVSFTLGMVMYVATLPFFPGWMQEHFLGATRENLIGAIRALHVVR